MCRLSIWKPLKTPSAGASPATSADSPFRLTSCAVRRFKSIGHRERQAGQGLASHACLGIRHQQAHVNAIGRMLTAAPGPARFQVDAGGLKSGLIQRAVQRPGVRNQQPHDCRRAAGSERLMGMRTLRSGCCQGRSVASTTTVSPAWTMSLETRRAVSSSTCTRWGMA